MVLKFAIDMFLNRFRRTLTTAVLLAVSVLLIIFSVVIYTGHNFSYNSVDNLLISGVENTAVLRINSENGNISKFFDEIAEKPEIAVFGSSYNMGTESYVMPELYEIQHRSKSENYKDNFIKTTRVSADCLNLCEFRIRDGTPPENLDFTQNLNKMIVYLYLGSAFDEIPIGKEFETEHIKYKVAGILEKSQKWIDESLLYGFDINGADYTFDCKYSVFCVYNGISTSDVWLCPSENYTINQAVDSVLECADKYGINVRYDLLKNSYEKANSDWITINSILSKLIFIVILSGFVMIICIQLVGVLSEKKNIGIMLSVGFSETEIQLALALKNILTCLISLVMIIPVSIYVIKWYFNIDFNDSVFRVLFTKAYPTAILVLLCVCCLSSLVSVLMIKKMSIFEMIGGQHD